MSWIQGRFDTNATTGETALIVVDEDHEAVFLVHPDMPMPSDADLRMLLAGALDEDDH